MEKQMLILVDKKDQAIGTMGKEKCHCLPGFLHRAFLVMIFNPKGELLLAKRSQHKPLWPDIWDGSIASHPRVGETLEVAAKRRLIEEVGIIRPIELEKLFKFEYKAFWGEEKVEKEMCTVFRVVCREEINPDPQEINDFYWVSLKKLEQEFKNSPHKYTPWFSLAFGKSSRLRSI
jgi:isopentenyl-diphosphate delta-isomerase